MTSFFPLAAGTGAAASSDVLLLVAFVSAALAISFICSILEAALGGGGTASLRYDPQGKAYAQMLLDMPLRIPASLLAGDAILGSA